MTRKNIQTNVCHSSGAWQDDDEPLLRRAALAAVHADSPDAVTRVGARKDESSDFMISLYLCDSQEMTALNEQYRGLSTDTNVLSFWDKEAQRAWQENKQGVFHLGDVVLADEVVRREAQDYGFARDIYACRLTIHGVLHLLGYDHKETMDARLMTEKETHAVRAIARNDALVA
ncbi:MAG: rRNA maturation RNase YbeY [Alphaproteobacteria bacterium GM202ARS2]|nr:rRNA maturation RNase YbeY [Alphaproteobacteria bacterium GM202ARS2]